MRAGEDSKERRRLLDDCRGYLDALAQLDVTEVEHRPSIDDDPALRRSYAKVRRGLYERATEALRGLDALEKPGRAGGSTGEAR